MHENIGLKREGWYTMNLSLNIFSASICLAKFQINKVFNKIFV